MFRLLFLVILAAAAYWAVTSVPLGERSLAEHVIRIWDSEETHALREGVVEKASSESTQEVVETAARHATPVLNRIGRGLEAGAREVME